MKGKSGLLGEVEIDEELSKLFSTDRTESEKVLEESKEDVDIVVQVESGDDSIASSIKSSQEEVVQESSNPHSSQENEPREMSSAEKTRRQKIQETIAKNLRTLFVGNVSTLVVEKSHTRDFKKLFQQHGELESIRFRSIAFNGHMPRKEAFLQKKLHEKRDTLNAYVVFKQQEDAEKALDLNGSVFMEKHLRVDKTETKQEKKRDSKRCIFIGNLNFDLTDEAIWSVFGDLGIEYVRVVRDRKTNIGKGFGYVQFKDKSSASLALKLNGTNVDVFG
jgi:nucleolar protein 12